MMDHHCRYCGGRGKLDPYMAGFNAGMQQAAWDTYRTNVAASMAADMRRYIEAQETDLMCGTVPEWNVFDIFDIHDLSRMVAEPPKPKPNLAALLAEQPVWDEA